MPTCLRRAFSLLGFCALLFAQTSSPTAPQTGTVEGDVTDSLTHKPIARARVKLEAGERALFTRCDEHGRFQFQGVPVGRYRAQADQPGYMAVGEPIGVQLSSDKTRAQANVVLAPYGVISGRIADPAGVPMHGVRVELLKPRPADSKSRDFSVIAPSMGKQGGRDLVSAGYTSTNDLGEYRFARLAAGDYYVYFESGEHPSYPDPAERPTYYPHTVDAGSARPVAVAAGMEVPHIDIQTIRQVPKRISGHLVPTVYSPKGHSFAIRTTVVIWPADERPVGGASNLRIESRQPAEDSGLELGLDGNRQGRAVLLEHHRAMYVDQGMHGDLHVEILVCQLNGAAPRHQHFQFDGLAKGKHDLMAVRTGYMRIYESIVLTHGQHLAIGRSLVPQGAVTGRAEDQDGFPVAHAKVCALARDSFGELIWRGGSETDDLGKFRVTALPSGRYYLRAEPGSAWDWDSRNVAVYYPAAVNLNDSQAIDVSPGQERAGMLVRIQRPAGVRVQGRVALPPGFSLANAGLATVLLIGVAPTFGPNNVARLADDGSFTLNSVPPGEYRLQPQLPPPYSRGYAMGMESNLKVGTTDITGIVLHAEETTLLELHGDVAFEAGTEPDYVVVSLRNRAERVVAIDAPNGIHWNALPMGKYRIEANSLESHTVPVSARLGEVDLPNGDLELKDPEPGRLVITMSSVVARVEGVVVDSAGQPVPGQYALFRAIKPGLQRVVLGIARPGGHFSAILRPGEYRVWTAADVPANLWEGAADAPPGQGRLITFVKGENPPLRLVQPAAR